MINFAARKGYYIRMTLSDIYRKSFYLFILRGYKEKGWIENKERKEIGANQYNVLS